MIDAEDKILVPFYKSVHEAIREVDDKKIVFYEPLTYDVWPVRFNEIPVGGEVYANRSAMSYHIYCPLAGGDREPDLIKISCQRLDLQFFRERRSDVKRIGGGGIMTEWGSLSNTTLDIFEIMHILELADQHRVSHIYWQYKDYQDITSTGGDGISLYPGGNIQDKKVAVLARTYAEAVAGSTTKMMFGGSEEENVFYLHYIPSAFPDNDDFGKEEWNKDSARTVIRVNREHHYSRGGIKGINVRVDWGSHDMSGEISCSEDGRKIYIDHKSQSKNVSALISVTVRPCFGDSCTC